MTIKAAPPFSLSDIGKEYDATAPYSLSDFLGKPGAPSAPPATMEQWAGKSKSSSRTGMYLTCKDYAASRIATQRKVGYMTVSQSVNVTVNNAVPPVTGQFTLLTSTYRYPPFLPRRPSFTSPISSTYISMSFDCKFVQISIPVTSVYLVQVIDFLGNTAECIFQLYGIAYLSSSSSSIRNRPPVNPPRDHKIMADKADRALKLMRADKESPVNHRIKQADVAKN